MRSIRGVMVGLAVAVLALALPWQGSSAWAQSPPGERSQRSSDRPWAEGVSRENQRRALALFQDANQLWDQALFAEAAEVYRRALALWDHPGIHYNLAKTLIHLERPVDAFASLERALAYGPQALDTQQFREAENYRTLLQQQLATIEVACDEPEAEVILDGERFFVGPGSARRVVRPGEHLLVASKPGHLSAQRPVILLPGANESVTLELRPIEQIAFLELRCRQTDTVVLLDGQARDCAEPIVEVLEPGQHRVVASKPNYITAEAALELAPGQRAVYEIALVPTVIDDKDDRYIRRRRAVIVTGAAAVVTIFGAAMRWRAGVDFHRYDQAFMDECPFGCLRDELSESTQSLKTRAAWENRIGVASLITGSLAMAGGVVWIILERPFDIAEKPAIRSLQPGADPSGPAVNTASAGATEFERYRHSAAPATAQTHPARSRFELAIGLTSITARWHF